MDVTNDIILTILEISSIFFCIYFLMYRRYIYSIIDPLFFFVFTTSFASVLAIYIIPNVEDLVHFFCCQLFLWLGFSFSQTKYKAYLLNYNDKISNDQNFLDLFILEISVYISFFIFIISNFIVWYFKGFALLAESPSNAKFENFQEGFGFFRKMNWALSTFAVISFTYMYLLKRKNVYLFCILLISMLSSLEGSKSAFLQIIFASGVVLYHPLFARETYMLAKVKKYLPILIIFSLTIVVIVLAKETENASFIYLAFIRRLLYSSDSLIYFYTPTNISFFEHYSIGEYLARLFNPILGFLRIQPYQDALGNTLYDNLRLPGIEPESITVGPNAPFYLEGRIYFYYWFAFPYSFLVGFIYAKIRSNYFLLRKSTSFYFVFSASVCHFSQSIFIDTNLTVAQLFNLFFFVIPIFATVCFMVKGKFVTKYWTWSKSIDVL